MNGNIIGFLQIWFLYFLGTSCDKRFQVTSSWLRTSHCQILSCISDPWYSYLLSCPTTETGQDATIQRYHLICTGSSFPHASNLATFFICTKCQCPFPHQTANHSIPFFHLTLLNFCSVFILFFYILVSSIHWLSTSDRTPQRGFCCCKGSVVSWVPRRCKGQCFYIALPFMSSTFSSHE